MSPRVPYIIALSIFVLAGCTDSAGEEAEGAPHASTNTSSGSEPPASSAPDNAAERQAKQAHREPGETEVMEIDWSDAAAHRQTDPSPLPAEARADLDRATLPVLLPPGEQMLTDANLSLGDTWYACSMHPAGDSPRHHVRINGRKLAVHQPGLAADVPEEQRTPEGEPSLSRTHSIVSVAFSAFGAAYLMEIECDAPTTDTRCTEDSYALSLFETLGVAGGVAR